MQLSKYNPQRTKDKFDHMHAWETGSIAPFIINLGFI
jgi:hypothetical protein